MKWELTPDEFMHIWRETGADRYPFPLRLIASVRWEDEFFRLTIELEQRLPLGGDPDLTAVLRVAADPERSLALIGTRRRPLRAYGAIDTDIGVTLVQRPGSTSDFGGDVVIEVGTAATVPRVFAAVLGDVAPGDHPPLAEDTNRLLDSFESWNGTKETTSDRIRRLLSPPPLGFRNHRMRPRPTQFTQPRVAELVRHRRRRPILVSPPVQRISPRAM